MQILRIVQKNVAQNAAKSCRCHIRALKRRYTILQQNTVTQMLSGPDRILKLIMEQEREKGVGWGEINTPPPPHTQLMFKISSYKRIGLSMKTNTSRLEALIGFYSQPQKHGRLPPTSQP